MLKAIDVHKSYGNLQVLKGVSLEVKKGEIVSIVGASGAGKTTLLQILGTLDDMDQGFLEINQTKIEAKPKIELNPVAWFIRLINFFVDYIAITLITFLFFLGIAIILEPNLEGKSLPLLHIIVPAFVFYVTPILITALYYLVMEVITGRTIGKYLTNTKVVVKSVGTKPRLGNILPRTMLRLIAFDWVTFFSKRPEGWHDSISNTLVVKNDRPYQVLPKNSLTDEQLSVFRNKNIGFIFQFHNLLPEFTALENVCLPGYLGNRNDEEVKNKAIKILDILGLGDRVGHKPSELSGGEQQRVAIARALINDPQIILADEPSGNLDSHNAEELHKLFFKLRENLNQTFVIVTHNEKLADMADRKLEMADGKMLPSIR